METARPSSYLPLVSPTAPRGKAKTRPAARIGENSRISRRGFASLNPEQRRQVASEGGRASHESGRGHKWTPEEARAAGSKGGRISRRGPGNPPAVD